MGTKIRHSFDGCGSLGGFAASGELIVGSGVILLGDPAGTQTTFQGTATVAVSASRDLTNADDGQILECTNTGLTLTVPAGLRTNFGCGVIPNGTTSIASSGGALLNGSTSTVTRAAASNFAFGIISRASTTDSYVVTGS